jgi:hypothetical protein
MDNDNNIYVGDKRMVGYIKKGMRWELLKIYIEKLEATVGNTNTNIEYNRFIRKMHLDFLKQLLEEVEKKALEFDEKIEIIKKGEKNG